ncbi:hypothetical protein D7V97_08330 [Corallococcus sp. CA053C]|uniref:hypothetical protein n=1 Tax=Corallococcus sp. CA053C TaxID=2316732 RepID=UPI000EBC73B0|nr:hypothetical protein [Corallococcus sp. CA053C]RKH12437.1 hypothetical protein D7V97_08330 [Corallococcus sp. CA053C]
MAAGAELWVVGGSLDRSYFTTGTPQLWRAKRSASRIEGWESIEAPSALHFDQTPGMYGPGSGFTASQGEDGRIYVFGGTSANPDEHRNARVWSSQRLTP